MERAVLGVSMRDQIGNEEIHKRSQGHQQLSQC